MTLIDQLKSRAAGQDPKIEITPEEARLLLAALNADAPKVRAWRAPWHSDWRAVLVDGDLWVMERWPEEWCWVLVRAEDYPSLVEYYENNYIELPPTEAEALNAERLKALKGAAQ